MHRSDKPRMRDDDPHQKRLALASRGALGRNVLLAMNEDKVSAMRAIEGAAHGTIALARISQHLAIAILDLDRRLVSNRRLHPAVKREIGGGKQRFRIVRRFDLDSQPFDAFGTRGGERNAELGDFVFGRVKPARIRYPFLEQAVPGTQRPLEGGDAGVVLGVDREHKAIEKTTAIARGSKKQAVHLGNEPDNTQVLCELSGRSDIFARNTRSPHGLLAFGGGIDAGAKLHLALGTFDGRGDRPGAIAIACGYILERCTPQAPSRREKRYRFQNIRLPRTIRAEKNDRAMADDEFGT
jgi:hypothetical protein